MQWEELLRSNGYTAESIWGCEWKKVREELSHRIEIEQSAKDCRIVIRDAMFGGRTEGFKTYAKCNEHEKIFYFDVTSLYPTVNALDDYAVGFGRYVKTSVEDIRSGKFFGLAQVDITPPKDLDVPLLLDNSNGSLLFHLNELKQKTFPSIELKKHWNLATRSQRSTEQSSMTNTMG